MIHKCEDREITTVGNVNGCSYGTWTTGEPGKGEASLRKPKSAAIRYTNDLE